MRRFHVEPPTPTAWERTQSNPRASSSFRTWVVSGKALAAGLKSRPAASALPLIPVRLREPQFLALTMH